MCRFDNPHEQKALAWIAKSKPLDGGLLHLALSWLDCQNHLEKCNSRGSTSQSLPAQALQSAKADFVIAGCGLNRQQSRTA